MADKPIIFSAPMVRALLDGRKTQTRRVLKPQPIGIPEFYLPMSDEDAFWATFDEDERCTRLRLLYAPGDRLLVREGFGICHSCGQPIYRADIVETDDRGMPICSCDAALGRWRSSIHMPRWASRLTLTVTDVRVQRLQEISEADAAAEGCSAYKFPGPWWQGYRDMGDGDLMHQECIGDDPPDWMIEPKRMKDHAHLNRTAVSAFRTLWSSLHGPGAWDANPWVAAISFTVHRCNIDTMEEGTW